MNRRFVNYGWQPDLPDQRDFLYAAPHSLALKLPKKVDMRKNCPPIYDQGQLGSCTANAIAGAFEFGLLKQKMPDFVPSRLFIYYNERVIENSVDYDSGAMLRDGIKTVNKQGVCPEPEWPYVITEFAQKPHAICYTDALKHQVLSYQRVARSADQMKACLSEGYPFVFGFTVYESFESDAVAKTGQLNLPKKSEHVAGGHAVLAVGYDDANKRFIARNSWGKDWGLRGYFTIPYQYLLNENLSDDFWTIRLVETEAQKRNRKRSVDVSEDDHDESGLMNRRSIVLLCLPVFLMACVNIKSINQYSSSAKKAVGKFDEIPYSFSQHCLDRCRMNAIDSALIYRSIPCHCDQYRRADAVTYSLLKGLTVYFDELGKLSEGLTNYDTDALKQAISEEDLGVLQVKKEDADAYASIADILLRTVTGSYRQNRIKIYIGEANASIQLILTKLEFIMNSNLNSLVLSRKERLFDNYRGLSLTKMSRYEKQRSAAEYYEELDKLSLVEKEISTFGRSLKAVAQGHQKLYDNREKLSAKESWRNLSPIVSDIRDLVAEFDKLKVK